MPRTEIVVSECTNPFVNLAAEEWLLRMAAPEQTHLLIYRNAPAAVIGRNQNPWLECDLETMAHNNVALARRVSGGGAVYHDLGNTNFSVVLPRQLYEPALHVKLARDALERMGIPVTLNDRRDLVYAGKKVSGSAFTLTGKRALQHATMLFSVNRELLQSVLSPPRQDIETKAVCSVRSPVANLAESYRNASHGHFVRSMIEVLKARTENVTVRKAGQKELLASCPGLKQYVSKLHSREWVYERTPVFRHSFIAAGADSEYCLEIRNGRINDITVPNNKQLPHNHQITVEKTLLGTPYDPETIGRILQTRIPPVSHQPEPA